jgi:hypothetical protein
MVLTETTCNLLEEVRLAIEVLIGSRIRLRRVLLEKGLASGSCQVFGLGQLFSCSFSKGGDHLAFIELAGVKYDVTFEDTYFPGDTVKMIMSGVGRVWIKGLSFASRQEEFA